MNNLDGPAREALAEVLNYNWADEEADYADSPGENHIFLSLRHLREMLESLPPLVRYEIWWGWRGGREKFRDEVLGLDAEDAILQHFAKLRDKYPRDARVPMAIAAEPIDMV